jgi:hypothetical protein
MIPETVSLFITTTFPIRLSTINWTALTNSVSAEMLITGELMKLATLSCSSSACDVICLSFAFLIYLKRANAVQCSAKPKNTSEDLAK